MFIRLRRYVALVASEAALREQLSAAAALNEMLKADLAEVRGDLRMVLGLKQRSATPPVAEGAAPTPRSQRDSVLQMNESPRQFQSRMQAKFDSVARLADQQEATAALAAFEEDLKRI